VEHPPARLAAVTSRRHQSPVRDATRHHVSLGTSLRGPVVVDASMRTLVASRLGSRPCGILPGQIPTPRRVVLRGPPPFELL
jgi:hypothetical protein